MKKLLAIALIHFGICCQAQSSFSLAVYRTAVQYVIQDSLTANFVRQAFLQGATANNLYSARVRALDGLAKDFRDSGILSTYVIIYPYIGASLTTNRLNLLSPYDADTSYRLTFTGAFTHTATGLVNPISASAWGNSHFVPTTKLSTFNVGLSVYNSGSATASAVNYDIGCRAGTTQLFEMNINLSGGMKVQLHQGVTASLTVADSKGFFSVAANSSSNIIMLHDTTVTAVGTSAGGTLNSMELYVAGYNNNGTGMGINTARTYSFMGVSSYQTLAQQKTAARIVHRYERALGRE